MKRERYFACVATLIAWFLSASTFTGYQAFSAQALSPSHYPETSCQSASECFQFALTRLKKVNGRSDPLSGAISAFQEVQTRFPGTIWDKRAAIRIGLLLTENEPETALEFFHAALEDFPILGDYVRFWMGEAQLQAGHPRAAAQVYQSIVDVEPNSLLQTDALLRGGNAWFQAGECESAIPLFRQALDQETDSSLAPQALLNLGRCKLSLKRPEGARAAFREIWWRFPTKPEAETALALLEQHNLDMGQGATLEERYKRALAFYTEALFAKAVDELKQYVRDAPGGPQYFEAQYKLGTALARLKRYDQAEKVFEHLSASASRYAGVGTVWLARVYLRQNKGSPLLALQHTSTFRKTSGDQQALMYIFSGVWLEDQGKYHQAIKTFRLAAKVGRSSQRRLEALWRIGWRHYLLGEHSQAISTFEEMQKIEDTGEEHARSLYWMARAMDHMSQTSQAQDLYQNLAQRLPFTYYGQLAESRLLQRTTAFVSVTGDVVLPHSDPVESTRLKSNRQYRKSVELIGLNLFQEAAQELRSLKRNFPWDPASLSLFLSRAQQARAYDVGIQLAIERFGEKLERGHIPRSSDIWIWAYPNGYLPAIQAHAAPGLDPYLVAGLIREESLYDPFAVSRVGALGLMQLMPGTAVVVARQLGLASPQREELFDAEANIQLGTTYVNDLFHQFQGSLTQTVAAYNAGPDAVNRWIAKNGRNPADEFVESISFRETRGYVKRVLGSYRVYRALATGSCPAISLDRFC